MDEINETWILESGRLGCPSEMVEPYASRGVALIDLKKEMHDLHETEGLVWAGINETGGVEVRTGTKYVRLVVRQIRVFPASEERHPEVPREVLAPIKVWSNLSSEEILARLGL